MFKKLIVPILFTLLVITGCKKDNNDSPSDDPTVANEITGNISMPEGSTVDVNTLKIQSSIDISEVDNGIYTVKVAENNFNTLFLTNNNDEVLLMAYNYPGQTDLNIDASSTALAMIMNFPISQSLSKAGKQSFINQILDDPDFPTLKSKIDNLLVQGISPINTNNSGFTTDLLNFFGSVSTKHMREIDGDPVNIFQAGKLITFQNGGKFYASNIGVYKDGTKVKSFDLDRVAFVPTSIGNAISASGSTPPSNNEIIEETYNFEDDGEYEIKIRTGRMFDGSEENRDALIKNMTNYSMDIIFGILPLEGKPGCAANIYSNLKTVVEGVQGLGPVNSPQETLGLTYNILDAFFSQTSSSITCFLPEDAGFEEFKKSLKKYFGWMKWVSTIGNSGNLIIGVGQWIWDEPAMNLCYTVTGNNVDECGLSYPVCYREGSGIYYSWQDEYTVSSQNGFQKQLSGNITNDSVFIEYWYSAGLNTYRVNYRLGIEGDTLKGNRFECKTFAVGTSCTGETSNYAAIMVKDVCP